MRDQKALKVLETGKLALNLGATAITLFTLKLVEFSKSTQVSFDLIRAISYYLVALGFIGSGIVNSHKNKIEGVTTGALLLPLAILGFYCGIGDYSIAIIFATIIYLILKLKYFRIKIIGKVKKKRKKR